MKNIKHPPSIFQVILFWKLFINIFLLPITTLTTNCTTSSVISVYKNISLSTVEIIKNNGYAVEIHNVITEDGYILEMHRIPKSTNGQKPVRNYPVFFHHSFLSSSAEWVLGGVNTSLSMQLVDAGYDVWLTNCRGNLYSNKHVSLNSKQKDFWNFSLHEIGKYDLPAAINYILMKTNSSQLHYIGYSMGTTVFYIMASERPEFQSKIRLQISLAPVVYLSKMKSPMRYLAPYARLINTAYQWISNGMFMPQSKMNIFFASTVCRGKLTQTLICQKSFIFFICGSDPYLFNTKMIPLILGHFPLGTSFKVFEHFMQFNLKDNFSQYDFGSTMNLKHYNATEPPIYKLNSIQVPIVLFHGENDIIADVEDVIRLKAQLPKLLDVILVKNSFCNHVDFLWSLKVNEHINDPVKEILQKTDDIDWKYSSPSSSATFDNDLQWHNQDTNTGVGLKIGVHLPSIHFGNVTGNIKQTNGTEINRLLDDLILEPNLDKLWDNIDEIVSRMFPRSIYNNNLIRFERERERQKILLGNFIKFMKLVENKFSMLTGFSNGARTMVESRMEKINTSMVVNFDHYGLNKADRKMP